MQEPTLEPTAPPVREKPFADRKTWIRLLYMVLFGLVLNVLGMVLGIVAFVQACSLIATGEPFPELSNFGRKLADYTRHVVAFLCLATEDVPYPFAPDASRRSPGGSPEASRRPAEPFAGAPGVSGADVRA